MTDERRTIDDIDRESVWTRTISNGGPEAVAHLSDDCRSITETTTVVKHPTESLHPETPVCRYCDGTIEQPETQSTAPYRTLRDADPEDLLG